MKRPPAALLYACRSLVWRASWMVPANRRAEWHQSHDREIYHWIFFLAESERLTPGTRLEVLSFCWRVFPEAFWQRFNRERTLHRVDFALRSPGFCLAVLVSLLLGVVLATGFAPAVRSMVRSPYTDPGTLFAVRPAGRFLWFRSDKLSRVAQAWKSSPLVKTIALYSFQRGSIIGSRGELSGFAAQVTPNFFDVLGVNAARGRAFRESDAQDCSQCVLLSAEAWKNQFRSDPQILGKQAEVDGRAEKVIGILPRQFS